MSHESWHEITWVVSFRTLFHWTPSYAFTMTLDMLSLQSSIQDALDDVTVLSTCQHRLVYWQRGIQLVSTRSSTGRKTRALAALEHSLALVCVPQYPENDLVGFRRLQDSFECNSAHHSCFYIPNRVCLFTAACSTIAIAFMDININDQTWKLGEWRIYGA